MTLGELRVHYYPFNRKIRRKDGSYHHCIGISVHPYRCKLHHPDSAEIAQIYQELAAGQTKTEVARRHGLGKTTHRLARLLRKWEAAFSGVGGAQRLTQEKIATKTPAFTDTDLDELLRAYR